MVVIGLVEVPASIGLVEANVLRFLSFHTGGPGVVLRKVASELRFVRLFFRGAIEDARPLSLHLQWLPEKTTSQNATPRQPCIKQHRYPGYGGILIHLRELVTNLGVLLNDEVELSYLPWKILTIRAAIHKEHVAVLATVLHE